MARRVLIADGTATNRIAFKAALSSARYEVTAAASAEEAIAQVAGKGADLVVIEAALPGSGALKLLRELKTAGNTAPPSLVIVEGTDTDERADWLEAGATSVLTRPVGRGWLLTNLRSLLRQHEANSELMGQVETAHRLGFAETQMPFLAPPDIAVVASGRTVAGRVLRGLPDRLALPIALRTPGQVLSEPQPGKGPDLLILSEEEDMDEVMWLLAELRSNPATRRTAILVECPTGDIHCAARALDLGANAILRSEAGLQERALIVRRELSQKRAADIQRKRLDESLRLAARDHLTGLFNRRYASQYLNDLAHRAQAEGRSYGVLLIDVDRFKAINDRHGHAAGDEVLKGVAQTLQKNLRDHDLVARFGGEEFLVILPDTVPAEALIAAERLRLGVMSASFDVEGDTLPVTVSVGIACDQQDPQHAVNLADAALYRAKRDGRNLSRLANEGETMPPESGPGRRPSPLVAIRSGPAYSLSGR